VRKRPMVTRSLVRPCGQCGGDIIAPEWSEYLSTGAVRNIWTCEACGCDFEDSIYFSAPLEGLGLSDA
jgi:hypothetical protein